ncbi:hypothetical protein [Flavobacterium piscinae]|uniref:hypothetical protein n=2 Tax=Flavobacterium piscinae TaxID=2506424 RepID=UPI001FE8C0FF|nr:hypothetical protein [Flavobacterium piscinae]
MTKLIKLTTVIFLLTISYGFFSCSSEDGATEPANLIIKIKFDSNQIRLNNLGQPSVIPDGNAAQTPDMKNISAHYLELAPSATTLLGQGKVLYHAPETDLGDSMAIDFSQAKIVGQNEVFLTIPITPQMAGSYEWVRLSLSYQSGKIQVLSQGTTYTGTLDSFLGYNTYIGTHSIGNNVFPVNGNKLQGYWAFALDSFPYMTSGQAPAGATTVPNPLFQTSPVPQGSCVVTGKFENSLALVGNEKNDVVVTLSLSINNSFEWTEVNTDGKYEPSVGESVVDMGIRGMIPSFVQ